MDISLWHERYYPYFWAFISAALVRYFKLPIPENDYGNLLSAAISFAAIVLGFLAASQAMIAGYLNNKDTPAGKVFSIKEYRDRLSSYMLQSFIVLLVFALINMIGFFIEVTFRVTNVLAFWVFFGVAGVLCFFRVYMITMQVITSKISD